MKRETLKRKVASDRASIGYLRYSTLHVGVADECFTNMQSLDDWRREEWDR